MRSEPRTVDELVSRIEDQNDLERTEYSIGYLEAKAGEPFTPVYSDEVGSYSQGYAHGAGIIYGEEDLPAAGERGSGR